MSNTGITVRRAPAMKSVRGLTLIEILVAVLVVSVGLLGLAGLQAGALQQNHTAYTRTQVTNLAADITDRMRANRERAEAGDYDIAFDESAPSGSTVAASDLRTWRDLIDDVLPRGTGAVTVDGDDDVTVRICWLDTRESEQPTIESDCTGERELFTYRSRL